MNIDKITRVPITDVWRHEAKDLTPWLCRNIDILSETLALELTNAEREQSTGNFNVDIKAEDSQGNIVVIENQFGASDHDHLGKLITYRTAFDAKVAIWIVETPKQEHTNAINWLNETDNGCDFYLIKLEAIKIGTSAPAPLFSIIAEPSIESKVLGKIKKMDSERHLLRLRFWTLFLNTAKELRFSLFDAISPTKDSWVAAGAGKRGIQYSFWITQDSLRLELRIDRGKDTEEENKKIFNQFLEHKTTIEEVFGNVLEWNDTEGVRMCAIQQTLKLGGYRSKEEHWNRISQEAIEAMSKLQKATKNIVNNLRS